MEKVKRKSGFKYREKVYINGKPKLSPYFDRKTDAKAWKKRVLIERDRMLSLGIIQDIDLTISEYFEEFTSRKGDKAKRTIDSYNCTFKNHILPELGRLKLSETKLLHGERLKSTLRAKKNLSTRRTNNVLNHLKIMFNDAVKFDFLLTSPFKALEFIRDKPKKRNYWLRHEIETFLKANKDDHYYPLYVVALNLGLRKGEVLGMQTSQIDFENSQVEINHSLDRYSLRPSTKNGRSRVLAMNAVVRTTIEKLLHKRAFQSEYVFTTPEGKPICYSHFTQRVFYRAIDRAGVKRITFHECRESFASNFMMASGDIYSLKNLLGHQSVDVTQKSYAHLHPSFLREQANVVSFSGEICPNLKVIN